MQRWTYVWDTDDGPSVGPTFESEEAAKEGAYQEWKAYYGGNIGFYDEGERSEFERAINESPLLWFRPIEVNLQFVIDALQEKAAECDEHLHRMMLECWGETQEEEEAVRLMTREQLAESWHRAYQARCEGPGYLDGEYQPGLSGEDYETIDNSEGFDNGMATAIGVIRELAGIAEPTEEVAA